MRAFVVAAFCLGLLLTAGLTSRAVAQADGEKAPEKAPDKLPTLPEAKVEGQQPAPEPTPEPTAERNPGPFGPGGVFSGNVTGPFLPDVEGTQINAGKRTDNISLRDRPPIANNNLRQLLITVPGLNVSEESSPLFSVGYRGLEPHRGQFTQILKDGIPIHADQFGYPEAYYIPAFQTIDRVEFIRGGASLLYGPQPGGALNFITKMPVTDRGFSLYAENMFGSFGFFSTYEAVSGTNGNLGYYVYAHHREADGFRIANGGYDLNYGGGKFVVDINDHSRIIFGFDLYSEGHGEPGGLTLAAFNANPTTTTRFFDHFQLRRYAAQAIYQNAIDEDTMLEIRAWGVDYSRYSRRAAGGGFGGAPALTAQANYEQQDFATFGFEPRFRKDYDFLALDEPHTFTAGIQYYHTNSPRTDTANPSPNLNPTADAGRILNNQSVRKVDYLPFFAENLFRFGRLYVVPGVRVENFWQGVEENVNLAKTAAGVPLADEHVTDNGVLLGLGRVWTFNEDRTVQAYSNISQSYRPIIFTQAVVAAPNQVVAGNLQAGENWQAEVGFRGRPNSWLYWDTALFHMEFLDQIGTVARGGVTFVENVGDSIHRGWEASTGCDLSALSDSAFDTDIVSRFGSLGMFFNTTVLDARFFAGPNVGKRTQYAPYYLHRGGVTYAYLRGQSDATVGYAPGAYGGQEVLRVWFTGTFVGDQFANDNNTQQFYIPSYKVWDLTAEAALYKDCLKVFGGVYNIFDEKYFSRIRADGIDPATPRNYYAGLKLYW